MTIKNTSCSCVECKSLCWISAGWFGSVNEVKQAAKLCHVTPHEFAMEYLIQEWWAGDDEDTSIPAPRKNFNRNNLNLDNGTLDRIMCDERKRNGRGFVRATWAHNLLKGWACIFLNDLDECTIHMSKPRECKEAFGCGGSMSRGRERIVSYWKKHQDFIEILKGKVEIVD